VGQAKDIAGPAAQRFATRLNSFRNRPGGPASVETAIRAIAGVPGISAVELNYPQHFAGGANAPILAQAGAAGLAVTALNLRYDGPDFVHGAFTHPVAAHRERAIGISLEAVEVAARNGVGHVILWMGPDGFDYPFQADYGALWDLEIDGFQRVAAHHPRTRVSVEYKPSDPRRTSLVRSMADALLAVQAVGLANFGVTLDFCHSLMAGEQPAAAAALAIRAGRLFGVHLNDGYGPADDGLMVGSVHPWQTLELLWQLKAAAFQGTLYFDTFPDRVDPAGECAANVRTVLRLQRLLERIAPDEMKRIQSAQDGIAAAGLMQALLLEVPDA
jgi:xylose isomerase